MLKRQLLITCAKHLFYDFVESVLVDLASYFDIVLLIPIVTDTGNETHQAFYLKLADYLQSNTIVHYELLKYDVCSKVMFEQFKKIEAALYSFDFDVWVSPSQMQLEDCFVDKVILSPRCKRIIFWHGITYLFERKIIANLLPDLSLNQKCLAADKQQLNLSIRTKFSALRQGSSAIYESLKKLYKIMMHVYRLLPSKTRLINTRYIYPYRYFRKIFPYGKFDELTQIATQPSGIILFCDPLETLAHKKLYGTEKIYTISHPNIGSCRCAELSHKNSAILSPLSGILNVDVVSDAIVDEYFECFSKLITSTDASEIHLRLHPREMGEWPYFLREQLRCRGLKVEITSSEKSIREIVCDYLGVAGFASCALRDARASCNSIFVIAFERLSKLRYSIPKIMYGKGEGITWINSDGSYSDDAFLSAGYIQPVRRTLLEMLVQISITDNMDKMELL